MAKRKARASTHTKLYGLCENKCLVEVMSKEESNQKFSGVDSKFTETNQKITQTLTDAKAYTDTKTTEVKNTISNTITPQLNNKADKNLGNVANGDFLNKMKANGFVSGTKAIKMITPTLLIKAEGTAGNQKVVSITPQTGIFYVVFSDAEVMGINGKIGSVFKELTTVGASARVRLFGYSDNDSYSGEGFLIIDGVSNAVAVDYVHTLAQGFRFTNDKIPNLSSLTIYNRTDKPVIAIYKIAEFL